MKGNFSVLACIALLAAPAAVAQRLPLEHIKLPPGFEISVFAGNLPNVRALAVGRDLVFAGSTSGSVYALRYRDAKATQATTLASGLNLPNGVALREGALYVSRGKPHPALRRGRGATRGVCRRKAHSPAVVTDRFPHETHHGWKFIRFGPDGWLYVPVGAPCNICEPGSRATR